MGLKRLWKIFSLFFGWARRICQHYILTAFLLKPEIWWRFKLKFQFYFTIKFHVGCNSLLANSSSVDMMCSHQANRYLLCISYWNWSWWIIHMSVNVTVLPLPYEAWRAQPGDSKRGWQGWHLAILSKLAWGCECVWPHLRTFSGAISACRMICESVFDTLFALGFTHVDCEFSPERVSYLW